MKVTKKGALSLGAIAVASAFVLSGCQAASDDGGDKQASGSLTVWVDAERVEARYVDGILTLQLPKAEAAKPRQIQVHS